MGFVGHPEIRQQREPKSRNVENRGGKIVIWGGERGEMEADEMGTFGFDWKTVGRGSGEDSCRVVEI